MAFTHILNQVVVIPEGTITDAGTTYTGDTSWFLDGIVNANGGGANGILMAFPAAGLQSIGLLSTVPCVVTLTGAGKIDGVTGETVTLVANRLRHVSTVDTNCTAISIGANTDSAGLAGTIKIAILYNS